MIKLVINNEKINVDENEMLTIVDVSKDMDEVAALMGRWGALCAQAESEKIMVETYYRKWKAELTEKLLSKDGKLAEWKVRSKLEGNGEFEKLKMAIAQATKNYTTTKLIYGALEKKANMLQSKGAMMRSELDSTGASTRSNRITDSDLYVENMKRINKHPKRKTRKNNK